MRRIAVAAIALFALSCRSLAVPAADPRHASLRCQGMTTQSIVFIEDAYRVQEFRGTVTLTANDSPLPDVEIRFVASERPDLVHRVSTDENGRFMAPRVGPGVYAFRTCGPGYTSLGGVVEVADSAEDAELQIWVGLAF